MSAPQSGSSRILLGALTAGLLVLSLLACEIALRVYHRVAHGVPLTAILPYPRPRLFVMSPFLVFGPHVDRQIRDKQRPELAYWNAQGLRTRERLGEKPEGEIRVIALGGSTTEDIWNEEGIHWPWALEQALHARGLSQVRVYNAGNSGFSTAHLAIRLAFDVVEHRPDVVLLMENINDLTASYCAARDGVPLDGHYRVKYGTDFYTAVVREKDVSYLRLWATLRERIGRLFPREAEPVPAEVDLAPGKRLFARNLRTLVALARLHGIRPVLLTQPFTDDPELHQRMQEVGRFGATDPLVPPERLVTDLDVFNRVILEVGEREGVDVIDMAALLGRDPALYSDVVHYTADGSRAFGERLAPALAPLLAGD